MDDLASFSLNIKKDTKSQ